MLLACLMLSYPRHLHFAAAAAFANFADVHPGLLATPVRKQLTDSCCIHTQTGGYVQDRWLDANALHEQRHDSPQRGAHVVCFSLCIVSGVAVPALTFIITLLLQLLWCSFVKCLEYVLLSVCSFPSCSLFTCYD
jgi:Flp pilus assembly protein TadB